MKISQGQALMQKIYDCMDRRDYQGADGMSATLVQQAEKNGWHELLGSALEMRMVIAIESTLIKNTDEIMDKLKALPQTAYRSFLIARLLMKKGKNRDALANGWEAFRFSQEHIKETSTVVLEKICNLLGKLLSNYGNHNQALEFYRNSVDAADTLPLQALEYSNYLFNLHFVYSSPEYYYKEHIGYNALFKDISQYEHGEKYQLEAILKKPVGRIRIGYISPDLRNHVVLRFSWTMLSNYDKERFEVYCYHNNPNEDKYSEELRTMTDNWRNISGMSPEKAAEIIYQDNIDILVDLAGHTSNNPLPILAYKPAPVQVSGIGYFATTGLRAVDYFLSDKYLASEQEYFSEKIIRLEHSHFCYTPLYKALPTGNTPCIKIGYITFGSFNNLRKVNDEVLELWVNILLAVPESHLLLKGSIFDDEYGHELFVDRLKKLGIDMASEEWKNRIELRGFSKDYLKEYLDMDIALDTFPYPGGGTTCDALYMGVPVITLEGNSHGERFGSSLLHNIGLSEFVVQDKQGYFELAVALADNKEIINNLHIGLRHMMEQSPLMDKKLYMKELEAAYTDIWNKYIAQLQPVNTPSVEQVLNQSFDCYKQEDYKRAEAWCRLAISHDTNRQYTVEAMSLLSDILQARLDYVGAWKESQESLELLSQEKSKGTEEFQRRLWVNYASRSHKLGLIDEAAVGYKRAAELVADVYCKVGLKGSALLSRLCRSEDCHEVKEALEDIKSELGPAGELVVPARCKTKDKIHIAYISPDFRQHVMFSFYYAMLHG
ncbi:MAG: hypothetical protein K6C05_03095, partial [Anaerovibrio sp.]|nr:hypothetical protein [Anaerovibrio sp.]